MDETKKQNTALEKIKQFFCKVGAKLKQFFCAVGRLIKQNIKIPGIGFGCLFVAFVLSIVAFCNYYALYEMADYENNRWTVMFSWLTILLIVFLMVSSLFKGDKPIFMLIAHAAAVFMFAFAALEFMQPCVSEIAFVFGSPDLAMGDNAIRVAICDDSITTAVLYVVTCVFVIIAAFAPATWTFGKKKRAAKAAEKAKQEHEAAENADVDVNDVEKAENAEGETQSDDIAENVEVETQGDEEENVEKAESVDGEAEHE